MANQPEQPALTPEQLAALKEVPIAPVYVNGFHLQSTGNDFQIIFHRPRTLTDQTNSITGFARAEIVAVMAMSPQSLKDLHAVIGIQLAGFEKDFGEIQTIYTRTLKNKAT